jgi:hypothetical protein
MFQMIMQCHYSVSHSWLWEEQVPDVNEDDNGHIDDDDDDADDDHHHHHPGLR